MICFASAVLTLFVDIWTNSKRMTVIRSDPVEAMEPMGRH
jgi:hypothetical protein